MIESSQTWITDRRGSVRVAFLGRLGEGVDPVQELAAIRSKPKAECAIVVNRQVHSKRVTSVDEAPRDADGLIDFGPVCGRALGVFTADCVPVLITDSGQYGIAAIHAGWRGLAAGIIAEGWRRFGLEATSATTAWIGPSIGACCYEVSDEVAAQVAMRSGAAVVVAQPLRAPSSGYGPTAHRRPHLDLVTAAAVQLQRLGIEDIRRLSQCTHCDERWHSYRREGAGGGRNYGLIWRERGSVEPSGG